MKLLGDSADRYSRISLCVPVGETDVQEREYIPYQDHIDEVNALRKQLAALTERRSTNYPPNYFECPGAKCSQYQEAVERAEHAEAKCGRLLQEIENLKKRIQSMGELLEENDYAYCHFCEVWRLSEDVTCGDDGDPFCVHCYESWQWQCEHCSYRMPDGEGETCAECGGEMKRMEA